MITRFRVKGPKKVKPRGEPEKTHWYQIGYAQSDENGTVFVNINSLPLAAHWNGNLILEPMQDDQDSDGGIDDNDDFDKKR